MTKLTHKADFKLMIMPPFGPKEENYDNFEIQRSLLIYGVSVVNQIVRMTKDQKTRKKYKTWLYSNN